jgi:hypothetical protein
MGRRRNLRHERKVRELENMARYFYEENMELLRILENYSKKRVSKLCRDLGVV